MQVAPGACHGSRRCATVRSESAVLKLSPSLPTAVAIAAELAPINTPGPTPLPAVDPRKVPVLAPSVVLPPVALSELTPAALRARFAQPPHWTPELRREPRHSDHPPADAAVLVPLVQRPGGLTVLLTERASQMRHHSGQVAFPGGRVDPEDANIQAAALREAWEEVGLSAGYIEVLGSLPTYTTITAFIVTPVVALVQPGFVLTLSPGEVADAFEVPLAFLMDPANHRRHALRQPGQPQREWYSMPYQDGATERYVWGATAGMLRNLFHFLSA